MMLPAVLREARRARGIAVLALAMLALVSTASAQSVEVSPLRVDLTLAAGGSQTQAVTLSNQGEQPLRIRARLQDWFISLDGTPQFDAALPDAEKPFSTASWVRVAPPEQIVKPGEEGIVRFTTTVPAGTADGGYRAAILFEFGPATGDPLALRRQVQFRSRVATLVYVTVGKPAIAIELTNLEGRVRPQQPPAVVATLKNSGRGNVRTKGTLVIRSSGGESVRTLDVPNVPLLPMSEREVAILTAAEGQEPLPRGEYRVEVRLDVGMPELLVGETTVTVPQ